MYEELVMTLRAKASWRDPDDEYLFTQAADAIEKMSRWLAEWDKYNVEQNCNTSDTEVH